MAFGKCVKVVLAYWLLAASALVQAQASHYLQEARDLGGEIALFRGDAQAFVSGWNATGAACTQFSRVPFGNLRRPCREVRSALRNGEFLLFARQCVELGSRHNTLVEQYRAVSAELVAQRGDVEAVLLDNEKTLIASCSPTTWRADHPVFAQLRINASDPRYRTASNRFYAANPDYRLLATLETTLAATDAGTMREAPVTGAGSFAAGSD